MQKYKQTQKGGEHKEREGEITEELSKEDRKEERRKAKGEDTTQGSRHWRYVLNGPAALSLFLSLSHSQEHSFDSPSLGDAAVLTPSVEIDQTLSLCVFLFVYVRTCTSQMV